jgi:hypothetical protein
MLVVFSIDAYLLGDTEVSVFTWIIANSCQECSSSSVSSNILGICVYELPIFRYVLNTLLVSTVVDLVRGYKESLTCSICPVTII